MTCAVRDPIVAQALSILACQVREADGLASPDAARDFVRLRLGDRPHEVFACLFLDAQNRVIDFQELFRGTLTAHLSNRPSVALSV